MVSWSTLSANEMTVMVGQRSSPPGFVGRCASWVKVMNPGPMIDGRGPCRLNNGRKRVGGDLAPARFLR